MKKKVDHNPDLDRLPDWASKYKLGGKGPTPRQLLDSGFCRIKASADVANCIARLDKKTWLDHVHVEFPGSHSWPLMDSAHMYRTRLGKGFRNVPESILNQLPWSDGESAPVVFRYHWTFSGKRVEVAPAKPAKAGKAAKPAKMTAGMAEGMAAVRGISKAAARDAAAKAAERLKGAPLDGEHEPAPEAVKVPAMPKEYEMVTLADGTHVSVSKGDMDNPFAALAAMAQGDEPKSAEGEDQTEPVPPQQRSPKEDHDVEDGEWEHMHDGPLYEPTNPLPTKVVVVTFEATGAREYYYFATEDAKPGDHAVVYAKMEKDTGAKFAIGLIQRDDPDLEGMARYAILGTFNEEFAKQVQARMDRVSMVKARLQRKKDEYDERRIYELMAKEDPEARELLDLLKRLEGEL